MTQQLYTLPLTQFYLANDVVVAPFSIVNVLEEGAAALARLNTELGLGFDAWDIDFYSRLFQKEIMRNPTSVECFDIAQSNSEHSRHWFFSGKLVLDGKVMEETLFQLVKSTLSRSAQENSIIAFHDNSSVIRGSSVIALSPADASNPSVIMEKQRLFHLLLTAETHNFPCAIAPFPGAETGTGGRIRDVQATGRGAHVMAGISAYAVGNLFIPDYMLPWEDSYATYPSNLALPREILIQASNGASDYGNKFGEPVVAGFARSFGLSLADSTRREYLKPIMFSAGLGQIRADHCDKVPVQPSFLVVKLGGPAYRIGMGGGAASSRMQRSETAHLDFNAVQRGDAEMESKMNKVIRACIELETNPILSIHDQGAGGNGNVLKEIVFAEDGAKARGGARYDVKKIIIGDKTMSVLEIWGAEYQENNALLLNEKDLTLFTRICERERCPFSMIGTVTGDDRVVLMDGDNKAVDLDLNLVLGKMPQKTFEDETQQEILQSLDLEGVTVEAALDRVFRLVSVGSKRFLTTKVDRSVGGFVAQQQTVGPLQLPLSNCAVIAQSYMPNTNESFVTGIASACGEQPIKGLVDPAAMARLSVGEALTNLIWASLGHRGLEDCKCSANWMWAAKLKGEAVRMHKCCLAMTQVMKELGIAVDGGKDSLSMAVKESQDVNARDVKAPGTLVITMYALCDNVERTITPVLQPQESYLVYVDFGLGKYRLGGSALAQVYSQIGNMSPDLESVPSLRNAFQATQLAIHENIILAGHDRSDGGLITTLLEMAFSGPCGFEIDVKVDLKRLSHEAQVNLHTRVLFAEELGLVFQVSNANLKRFQEIFAAHNVENMILGHVTTSLGYKIHVNGELAMAGNVLDALDLYEATSFALEALQCDPECVLTERKSLRERHAPNWEISFSTLGKSMKSTRPRIAVLREEGSNGEREMFGAFHAAGFDVWDVSMSDLIEERMVLDDRFRGIAFVGGFTFSDVLGSGKGWAGVIRFHKALLSQFEAFKARKDTFTFGVCNGCQLMATLGWAGSDANGNCVKFSRNRSNRHESRFVNVKILPSKAIMLQGMENSSLGVWVSHGEGRCEFPEGLLDQCLKKDLAPLRYVDDDSQVTEAYPYNPNGSVHGIAALVSDDGRHLCMMPHPERCFVKFQWPYMPENIAKMEDSPWMRMFQNARVFCEQFDAEG